MLPMAHESMQVHRVSDEDAERARTDATDQMHIGEVCGCMQTDQMRTGEVCGCMQTCVT